MYSFSSFGQSNFDKGFQAGYAKGYCYNQGISCISPNPPIAPLPKIGESLDSYQDGYDSGFQTGLTKQNSPQTRKGYVTSSAEPMDYMYKADESTMKTVLEVVDNRITQNKKYRIALMEWILELKQQTTDNVFLSEVEKLYSQLNSMNPENDLVGFSKKGGELDEIKIKVKKQISDYNSKVNQVANTNSSVTNDNKNSTKDIFEALKYKNYQQVINLSNTYLRTSNNIEVYYCRGLAFSKIGKYFESIADFTKCLESNAQPTLYHLRANSKLKVEDYYGAISDFDKIIELNKAPENYDLASIHNDKAYTLVSLNKLNEALLSVNKALDIRKDKWYIWDTRGEIFYKSGFFKKCIEDMTMAISIKPDQNSYYFRGLSKIKMGDKVSGCQDLSKSGELGNPRAYTDIKKYCQ